MSITKTVVLAQKITLYPQGDKTEVERVYKYIRNGMEVQALMMNQCISALYSAIMRKASKEELKEIELLHNRIPTSRKGSAYTFDISKYPKGLPLAGCIPRLCKQRLFKSINDGLLYGKVSLPTFREDSPLYVHSDYVAIKGTRTKTDGNIKQSGLYHDYNNLSELNEALKNETKPKVHIKFANHIIFDVIFGNINRSIKTRSTILKCFEGTYRILDSSIGIDKRTNRKIILTLNYEAPIEEHDLNEDICVGVDLGLAIPAICALNNNLFEHEYIGSYDDFFRIKLQIHSQFRRIQQSMKMNKGGHGYKKKTAHLEKVKNRERQFVKNYNHNISKRIIDFAIKHNAKYINMEDLSDFTSNYHSDFILKNWSYHELQKMIVLKAQKQGIVVRFILPAYTSQTCSICGEKGIRKSQSEFICINPNCKCHEIYKNDFNADFNAARNIAMSINFTETS